MATTPRTICNNCQKPMSKAHVVWDDKGYCHSCYSRDFKLVSCPVCGEGVRALKGQEIKPCKKCRNIDRVCHGCSKPLPHAALIVDGKAFCPNCSRKQKPPKPCSICGELSIYLARDFKHNIDVPVCPRCRRKVSYINCADCGHNRQCAGVNKQGKSVCNSCLTRIETGTPFICEECGETANWHTNKKCHGCYKKELSIRAFAEHKHELSQPWVQSLYSGFSDFNSKVKVNGKLGVYVAKYLHFFKVIDKRCAGEEELNLYKLFSIFGASWEKQFTYVCSYLICINKIPPLDDVLHEEYRHFFSQERKYLSKCFGKWFHPLMIAFYKYQQGVSRIYKERGWTGKSIRYRQTSITTSLQIVLRFLTFIENDINKPEDISQILLNKFLFTTPGYRSGIRPFIRFLKQKKITRNKVKAERIPHNSISNNELGATKYVQTLDKCLNPEPGQAKNAILALFAIFYAQRPKQLRLLELTDVVEDSEGVYSVVFSKVAVPMDDEVNPVLKQYLAERKVPARYKDETNNFLFPGRTAKSPLGEGAIHIIFQRKFGIGTRATFPTAMLQVYRAGLQSPTVARRAYGVAGNTAVGYSKAANVRIRNEIDEIRKK